MKNFLDHINKQFESRVRLGIMSTLMVTDWADFVSLKELLDVTDGNLASHLVALENAAYIELKKEFVGRKPKTSYRATLEGRKAFEAHLKALEDLIKNMGK